MELRGADYNTKHQVHTLETLLAELPDLSTPVCSTPERRIPGTARQLDEPQVEELVATYRSGATIAVLGKRFGISNQTVSKILRQRAVPMRQRGLSPDQIDEAVRLYEAGDSLARIGERLGVNAKTVLNRLQERGVKTRDAQGRER